MSFLFLVMGLFLRAHTSQIKGTQITPVTEDSKSSAIYYDRIIKDEKAATKHYCCGLIRFRTTNKVDKKGEQSSDSSDLDQTKRTEYSVKYKDLEILLSDFNRAQEVLNKQLVDREAKNKRFIDQDGNLIETLNNEEQLLKEVQSMLTFVKQNKSCLASALENKPEQQTAQSVNAKQEVEGSEIMRKVAMALTTMVQKSQENEKYFNSKVDDKAKEQQRKSYE